MLNPTVHENTALLSFISVFNFKLITVSVQPSKDIEVPYLTGNYFTGGNRIQAVTLEVFRTQEFQQELIEAQVQGYEIYFTINEGNGLPEPYSTFKNGEPDLNCGKRKNIHTLKSLCIDSDSADYLSLARALKHYHLQPHIIVNTRPDRYHLYFLIHPVPNEGDSTLHWQATQKFLMSLVPGLDQSMSKTNQQLRLPTFYNLKSSPPHLIKSTLYSLPYYDLKHLFDRLSAHTYLDDLRTSPNGAGVNGHRSYTKYELPKVGEYLKEGSRRNAICSYIEHLLGNQLPLSTSKQDFFVWVDHFTITRLHPKDHEEYLTGSMRKNIETYYDERLALRIKEQHERDSIKAVQQFDAAVSLEESKLPDEFYLNFPGDWGMITREIHAFSKSLSLELCFAGAICISGALKAESYRLDGFWPMVNGIIIAPTGAGKSTLIHVIEASLRKAGLCGKYPQFFNFQNTVQSLHTQLYKAGGVATSVIDEAGDYLQAITSKRAETYASLLKQYYKNATTGREKGAIVTPGGSMSLKVPHTIVGAFLSLWMFLQPDKFSGNLSLEDMRDGFLPRFLVFKGNSDIEAMYERSGKKAKTFEPSIDMAVWMESLAALLPFGADDQLTEVLERTEQECRAKSSRTGMDRIKAAQTDAVFQIRSEARLSSPGYRVLLSEEAEAALNSYLSEWEARHRVIYLEDPNDPRLDVFVRIREMVSRLLCNAASLSRKVDIKLAEAVIAFHRFQTDRFLRDELVDMGRDMEMVHLVRNVAKACRKEGAPVTAKIILHSYRSNKRPKNISHLLNEAVNLGELIQEQRPHAKVKGKVVNIYRPVVEGEI